MKKNKLKIKNCSSSNGKWKMENGKWKFCEGGFTLIEMLATIAIFLIITGLMTMNLAHTQRSTSVQTAVEQFASDVRNQQIKAMNGEGTGGIDIDETNNKYTLFKGASHTPGPSDFTVNLNQGINISSNFTGHEIIFNQPSGEIKDYIQGNDWVQIKNANGTENQKLIFNKYGVIYQIDNNL